MFKKSLLVLSVISLFFLAGCELGQKQTILIVKNSNSSDTYIRYITIEQYVSGRIQNLGPNALHGVNTLARGESQSFEIAPYTSSVRPLEIDVTFNDQSTKTCKLTYDPETTFTLICDNTAGLNIFSVEGAGVALVVED